MVRVLAELMIEVVMLVVVLLAVAVCEGMMPEFQHWK
jgi:hypothetical protein